MSSEMNLYGILVIGLVVLFSVALLVRNFLRQRWMKVFEGTFHAVRYEREMSKQVVGGMGAEKVIQVLTHVTVIDFTNGDYYPLSGYQTLHFHKGDKIQILENGLGEQKVLRVS